MKYIVKEEIELLAFLYQNINKSKNNVKNLLKNNVYVNDKKITKFNYLLKENDVVEIKSKIDNIDIIYEDNNIIVINKPSGLLTVSTSKEKEKTAYHLVSEYVKEKNKKSKIFVVHRLDRDTSGIVMFSKSESFRNRLQKNWNDLVKVREYIAIVEGVTKDKGEIKSYLKENKNGFIYSDKDGKLAITSFVKIKNNEDYSMLKINIKTGRKNQIRVHMKDINHPIIGDKKYGSSKDPINRLGLHANILELENPITHKMMHFETNIPNKFNKLFK